MTANRDDDTARRLLSRRDAGRLMAQGAALASVPALGACALNLPGQGDPARIYVLTPKSTFPENLPKVEWQLLVEEPRAPSGVATTRIALRHNLVELNYFARASWTDSAPKMLQSLLVESFENTGKIISVGRQVIGLRADFVLKTELREFQAEFFEEDGTEIPKDTAPNIRIRVNAKLVVMPEREIIASKTWEYVRRADGPRMDQIVRGYDFVLGKILKRLVSWTLRQGQERYLARDGPGA